MQIISRFYVLKIYFRGNIKTISYNKILLKSPQIHNIHSNLTFIILKAYKIILGTYSALF